MDRGWVGRGWVWAVAGSGPLPGILRGEESLVGSVRPGCGGGEERVGRAATYTRLRE